MSAKASCVIRPLNSADWPAVCAIYVAGIATGNATFETVPPSWVMWDSGHRSDLRLVATRDGEVAGWAAASNVSDRCCYAGVVEHSVYVHPEHQGEGIGRALLGALIEVSENSGIWTIQSGIFPENAASIALHEASGFRLVGRRERIGQLAGVWRDVLLFEHRQN
jgi:L-amino acid N-acyltransferase YncA